MTIDEFISQLSFENDKDTWFEGLYYCMVTGRKIPGIKMIRSALDFGLKDSKDLFEAIAWNNPISPSHTKDTFLIKALTLMRQNLEIEKNNYYMLKNKYEGFDNN